MADLQIYIMDLDGTLLPSHEVDNRCYWQAIDEVFGTATGTRDLAAFEHVTDTGILSEWTLRQLSRPPTLAETEQVKKAFLDRLAQAADLEPACFRPIVGAMAWLRAQQAQESVRLAIATGGWGHTARFKLAASGLDAFALPLASADDAASRTGIMRHALGLLGIGEQQSVAETTYIGDGVWDLRASEALDWQFIGIASGERAVRLLDAGAHRVVPDFSALPLA